MEGDRVNGIYIFWLIGYPVCFALFLWGQAREHGKIDLLDVLAGSVYSLSMWFGVSFVLLFNDYFGFRIPDITLWKSNTPTKQ